MPARRSRTHGFTLLEVIVVMALLSLVMLAMGSALRTTAQTEVRVDARLARIDEMRVAVGFLRGVLARISLQQAPARLASDASPFAFGGAQHEMRWLGVMPARHGVGGRHHFRLGIDARGLVLHYVAWQGEQEPDWSRSDSMVLVAQATGLELRYEDLSVEPVAWQSQWESVKELPQRVLLTVHTAQGPWPELAVTMRPLPNSDPTLSRRAVFGGSR